MAANAERPGRAGGRCRGGAAAASACALLVMLAAACGGGTAVRGGGAAAGATPAPAPAGPLVAVAPMENLSNDLDASDVIRKAFVEQIAQQGWNVMSTDESDRLLREGLGISYGGQLGAATPAQVCGTVGAEGVFYGEVREWVKTTAGVYNSIAVAASFKLFRKDGSEAWTGADRQTRVLTPQGAGRDIGGQIIGAALLNLLNPVAPFGRQVGRNIGRQLRPGALETK